MRACRTLYLALDSGRTPMSRMAIVRRVVLLDRCVDASVGVAPGLIKKSRRRPAPPTLPRLGGDV